MAEEAADTETRQVAAVNGLVPRPATELRKDLLAGSGLFLFAFALYLLPAVLSRPLNESPELRAALSAREMLKNGEYVTPNINGVPQLQRPPMQVWLSAGTAQLLSSSEGPTPRVLSRAVQMPSAVFAALTVLLVTLFGCAVYGRPAGVIAGVIQAVSHLAVAYSQQGYGDPVLMFFCASALCGAAWISAHPSPGALSAFALGAGLGLALLTRAVFPAILVLVPLLLALLLNGLSGRRVLFTVVALALAAVVAVPWFVMLDHRQPGGAAQVLNAALESLSPSHPQPTGNRWVFYPYHLVTDLLPFTLLLVPALLIRALQKPAHTDVSQQDRLATLCTRYLLLALLVGFIALYAGAYQRVQFLLPLLPALALCSGRLLSLYRAPGGIDEEKLAWSQTALGLVLALGLLSMPLWAGAQLAGPSTAGLAEILEQPLTLPILVVISIGVLLLFLYGARQWVEGRPAAAVAALGIVAYASYAGWNVYSVRREVRGVPLVAEAQKISEQIALMGHDVRVYCYEMNDMQATLWLNRPAQTLRDLAHEETGKTGAFAPLRVVLLPLDKTEKLAEKFGIAPDDLSPAPTGKLRIIPLSRESDWPALLAGKIGRQ